MIRAFIETEDYNMIAFIWDDKMICCDCENIYEANEFDYSGIVDCETAEEAAEYCAKDVIQFNPENYNDITFIGTALTDNIAIEKQTFYLTTGGKYLQPYTCCYFGELSDGSITSFDTINDPDECGICAVGVCISPDLEYLVFYRVIKRCDKKFLDSKIEIVDIVKL